MSEGVIYKGCTNHGCVYHLIYPELAKGMHTNGGCHCDARNIVRNLQAENAHLKEKLAYQNRWLSDGVYYTTAQANAMHASYREEIAQLKEELVTTTGELRKTRERCRVATQMIIEEIGSCGPESLESALGRLVAQLCQAQANADSQQRVAISAQAREQRMRELLKAIVAQYDYEYQEFVTEDTITPARQALEEAGT